jgi:uncharacterized protein YbjT (DUF2867 family)
VFIVKILVTTPNGKVGSEVVKQLVAHGVPVRAGVHNMKHASSLDGAEVTHFDFADETSVKRALEDVSALYLAAPSTMAAELPKRVIDLAKTAGVKRVVQLSAMGAENSDTPLRQIEQHLELSGLEYTILRPTWFFQNFNAGQREYIRQANAIIEPSGDGRTAFVDTRDVAAVAVKALTEDGHHGRAYGLTGSRALSRAEVAEAISQATGKTVTYQSLTDDEFRAQTVREQWPTVIANQMGWLYGMVRQGWTQTVTKTVQQVLNREPISLERYAQDHREAWL